MSSLPSQFSQLQPFLDEYRGQQDAANAANEGRYRQLLRTARRGGHAERNLIRRDFGDQRGEMQQSLLSRGLFNTTILDSMNTRSRESENVALSQSRQAQRDKVMGVIERRTDQQPNLGLLTSLIQGASQGIGQQQGQAGAGAGRSFNFGGVNPSRFSTGGGSFGGGGGSSGGSGGGSFAETHGGSGGGTSGPGVTGARNTGAGYDASEFVYIPGFGRVRRGVNIYDIQRPQPGYSSGQRGGYVGGGG
jgi:hypothetical protein